MKILVYAVFFLAALLSGVANVQGATQLDTVTVWATTTDSIFVLVPKFAGGALHLQRSPTKRPDDPPDYTVPMTKAQFCSALAAQKPSNCSLGTYPASPGIKSASGATWSGNGCGAGPWSTAFASLALRVKYGSEYSGDMNRPVAGNPSIDFTRICNDHDACYTGVLSQGICDNKFGTSLRTFCDSSTSPAACGNFASDYTKAVQQYGSSAYAEDQAQLQCSVWGDSMKTDGCRE